ncbi:hypothetical protein N7492_005898 [Penicillium capsulatum]|uniref:Uncharacterized protein n=1 Tax=Penicillium capsulatum TaxID=69766 RepID=A0A9W9LSD5_9EURO|nr:hypothetical protein N7492_005898 [Penicillium capsulatum]KAJ6135000.1 hypothetical protein N7512_000160 [Penicillium capsulatum]
MPLPSPYVLQVPNAKEAALASLLKKGNKRVLWDSCELIWDAYELVGQRAKKPQQVSFANLDDRTTGLRSEQLAVFGVAGIVESHRHQHFHFQLRYNVDVNRPRYRVNVTLVQVGDRREFYEKEYVTRGLFLESAHQQFLVDGIVGLTAQAQAGAEATIRAFLTPAGAKS